MLFLVRRLSYVCLWWFAANNCSVSCSAYCVKFVFYSIPPLVGLLASIAWAQVTIEFCDMKCAEI